MCESMNDSSCSRSSSVRASYEKSMTQRYGLAGARVETAPGRSLEQQAADAAARDVQAAQPHQHQVDHMPEQPGPDHAQGQRAEQGHALVQRRALDQDLDR